MPPRPSSVAAATPSRARALLTAFARRVRQTASLMVGVPDYRSYVEHRKAMHPGEPVMSYEEFFRERQNSRYGGKVGRCC